MQIRVPSAHHFAIPLVTLLYALTCVPVGAQCLMQSVPAHDEGDSTGWSIDLADTVLVLGDPASDLEDGHGAVTVARLYGDVVYKEVTLAPATATATESWGARFGEAVAASEEFIVVGATNDGSSYRGSATVFRYESGEWEEIQVLDPPTTSASQSFGYSVAIDGHRLVVGSLADFAIVYTWDPEAEEWEQEQELTPGDATDTLFGADVAIHGNLIVVGAYLSEDYGEAFVYEFDDEAGEWVEEAVLSDPDPVPNEVYDWFYFGMKVECEGSTVVVSAPAESSGDLSSGKVYIYDDGDDGWTLTQELTQDEPLEYGKFGSDLSLSGDTLAISGYATRQDDPTVFCYQREDGEWSAYTDVIYEGSSTVRFFDRVVTNGEQVIVTDWALFNGNTFVFDLEGEDCDDSGTQDTCDYSLRIASNVDGVEIEISDTYCDADVYATPFALVHDFDLVTLTAPEVWDLALFKHWIMNGVVQEEGELEVDLSCCTAVAIYDTVWDELVDGFNEFVAVDRDEDGEMDGTERISSHEDVIERYTTEFDGEQTPQDVFLGILAEPNPDPASLSKVVRLQTLIANTRLTEISELGRLDDDEDEIPDVVLDEYEDEILELAEEARAAVEPVLASLLQIGDLIAYDRAAEAEPVDSTVGHLVYALEVLARAELREIEVHATRALQAAGGGDAGSEASARLEHLTRALDMAQILLATHLTEEEMGATRALDLGLFKAMAQQLVHEMQLNLVPAGWLEELSSPQEQQVFSGYVPNPSKPLSESGQGLWPDAVDAARSADSTWKTYQATARQVDQDRTAFATTFESLRSRYLDQLELLTGIDPDDGIYDDENEVPLGSGEAVGLYLGDVFAIEDDDEVIGTVGLHLNQIETSRLAIESARKGIDRIRALILAEQNRHSDRVVVETEEQELSLEQVADLLTGVGDYEYAPLPIGIDIDVLTPSRTSARNQGPRQVSFQPGFTIDGQATLVRVMQRANIRAPLTGNVKTRVRQLVFDLSVAFAEFQQRVKAYEGAVISYERLLLEIELHLREYLRARENFEDSYFANPAYRMLRDDLEEQYEWELRRAKILGYRAGRRLEYSWAERFDSADLGADFAAFDGVTSVFRAKTPFDVLVYLRALKEWNDSLADEYAATEEDDAVISLRKDILGFGDFSNGELLSTETLLAHRESFRTHIAANQLTEFLSEQISGSESHPALLLTFPLSAFSPVPTPDNPTPERPPIASKFDSSEWNRRIVRVDVNLVGSSDLLTGSSDQEVEVVLVQRGVAAFEANPQSDSDIVLFDPDPWEDDDAPFAYPNAVSVDASVNGNIANRVAGSTGFENRPVSASEWTIYISTNLGSASRLDLSLLRDIEIRIDYEAKAPDHELTLP